MQKYRKLPLVCSSCSALETEVERRINKKKREAATQGNNGTNRDEKIFELNAKLLMRMALACRVGDNDHDMSCHTHVHVFDKNGKIVLKY